MSNHVNAKDFVPDHSQRRTQLIDLLRQTSTRLSPKIRAEIADLLEGFEGGGLADTLMQVREVAGINNKVRLEEIPAQVHSKLRLCEAARLEAKDIATSAIGVLKWFLDGKIGSASKAIVRKMMGMEPRYNRVKFKQDTYAPIDIDEFGKCIKLLDLFPAWRERLPDMVTVSPEWAVLVANWPKLEAEYRAEMDGKAAEGRTTGKIQAYLLSLKETARVVA